jgi:hypothetical protein
MGSPLGFNLLHDFSGLAYIYLGNFPALRLEAVLWRLKMLREILHERRESLGTRVKLGLIVENQKQILDDLMNKMRIWVVLTSEDDKKTVLKELEKAPIGLKTEVFSIADVQAELSKLGK